MALEIEELKVTVESPTAWGRRLRITVPAEQVARERKQAVARLAQKVRLPGFRKGKIPAHVVEKRFGAAVEQETLERVMGEAYREILRKEGFEPITDGSIGNVQYESGADLTFDVGFEVRPAIELNRLGGFTVRRPPVTIQEGQIDQVLERLRDEHAVWQPVEDEVPMTGDRAAVEITPLDDSIGTREPRRYELVLGEGQALPAIEDVIRTLRPGQENDFTVDLPENSDDPNSPLEPHPIHVRLLEVKRPDKPPLDDAFAASVGDFADLGTLQERIREDLGKEAEREAERAVRHQLVASILEANPFEVPTSMVDGYLRQIVPDREGADEQRLAEARESVRQGAEFAIRRMLVIDRVADMESLRAVEAELDEKVSEIAGRLNRSTQDVKAQLRKNGRLADLAQELTEDKVFAYLKSLSTIE